MRSKQYIWGALSILFVNLTTIGSARAQGLPQPQPCQPGATDCDGWDTGTGAAWGWPAHWTPVTSLVTYTISNSTFDSSASLRVNPRGEFHRTSGSAGTFGQIFWNDSFKNSIQD